MHQQTELDGRCHVQSTIQNQRSTSLGQITSTKVESYSLIQLPLFHNRGTTGYRVTMNVLITLTGKPIIPFGPSEPLSPFSPC